MPLCCRTRRINRCWKEAENLSVDRKTINLKSLLFKINKAKCHEDAAKNPALSKNYYAIELKGLPVSPTI